MTPTAHARNLLGRMADAEFSPNQYEREAALVINRLLRELGEAPLLRKGDRVMTPHGPGFVAYLRMAPPEYTTVIGVSVYLDGRQNSKDPRYAGLSYTGTLYPPDEVRPHD